MREYNIIWVTSDEMKASSLSVYGHRWASTPTAERVAAAGVTFDKTYSQFPKCVPARCSFLTGRYPHTDGFRTITTRPRRPDETGDVDNMIALDDRHPNIITDLKRRGYRTSSFGKNHNVRWSVYRRWFDEVMYDDYVHPPRPEPSREPTADERRVLFCGRISDDYPMQHHHDRYAADKAISFIERHVKGHGGRPFFMLLDMGWPHPKYWGCPPWFDRVANEEIELPPRPPVAKDTAAVRRLYREVYGLDGMPDELWKTVIRAYQSMVAHSDMQVGRVLDAVEEGGIAEETIFIYSSDHGDFAGEYACVEKYDGMFYDCLVRVPLIIQLPGRIPRAERLAQHVELLDIYPTLCDLLEIETPETVHGRSLLPLIDGKTDAHKKCVFAEGGLEPHALRSAPSMERLGRDFVKHRVLLERPATMERAKMVVMGDYKYVYRVNGLHELYDLKEDPHELENRVDDPRYEGAIDEMREELLGWEVRTETDFPPVTELIA